jgi:hypothetical protein
MTLTLEVGVRVLCMTYRLIIATICAKYFQNPLNYEDIFVSNCFNWIFRHTDIPDAPEEVIDRTHIPYNSLY